MVIGNSFSDIIAAAESVRRIAVFVYDGVTLLDVAGPLDVFHEANAGEQRYDLAVVALEEGPVRASCGLTLQAEAFGVGYDTVIVAGCEGLPECPEPILDVLRALPSGTRRIASVCTGSFLLAAAGLLDGQAATTHWLYVDELRRRHPAVDVEPDAIFVRSDDVLTSAGVTSGIDLALALVEDDHGSEAARRVAQMLVVYLRRPGGQSQFSVGRLRSTSHRSVADAVAQIEANPAGSHTSTSMARSAGVSVRHLARLFDDEFGMSPSRYVEARRLQAAQELILSGMNVTEAAMRSGFGSDETLRRTFIRRLGVLPTDYRHRFRQSAAPRAQ